MSRYPPDERMPPYQGNQTNQRHVHFEPQIQNIQHSQHPSQSTQSTQYPPQPSTVNKPRTRTYEVPVSVPKLKEMIEIQPLASKITHRLEEDSKVMIAPSTLFVFGFLFLVVVFLFSLYFFKNSKYFDKEAEEISAAEGKTEKAPNGESIEREERPVSKALNQENGRGIKPPKPVPPTNSDEGRQYMMHQEEILKRRQEEMEKRQQVPYGETVAYPPATDTYSQSTQYQFRDESGNVIDPRTIDMSKYNVQDVV